MSDLTLADIPGRYANPPKEIISKLPRKTKSGGTVNLDFVGHGDVTLQVIEVDPEWEWEPLVIDQETGGPKIYERDGNLVMWARFKILDRWMIEVGTCPVGKDEADKELVGDFLRRAAMRRGFATKLWSKTDREAGLNGSKAHNDLEPKTANTTEATVVAVQTNGAPTPPQHAIDLMADVLKVETLDPANPPQEIPAWKWKYAVKTDEELDATDYKALAKICDVRVVEMLAQAKELAPKVGVAEPGHIDDVHGPLAQELRRWLLTPTDKF